MDTILAGLGGALPQAGAGGVLVVVIGFLIKLLLDEKQKHSDTRAGQQAVLDAQSARHAAELDRQAERLGRENDRELAQHVADLTDARLDRAAAWERADRLQGEADRARAAQYLAESVIPQAPREQGTP